MAAPPQDHKAWAAATASALGQAKTHGAKVKGAIELLLKKEAANLAAHAAEVKRQQEAAEKARQEALAAEERRRQAELRAELAAMNAEERRKMEADAKALAAAIAAKNTSKDTALRLEREWNDLESRKLHMGDAGRAIGKAIFDLQHELGRYWGLLKRCEMRLEMREKRPAEELFKDHVHEALDAEVGVLTAARASLQSFVKDANKAQSELRGAKRILVAAAARGRIKTHVHPPDPLKEMAKCISLPALVNKPASPKATAFVTPSGDCKYLPVNEGKDLEGKSIEELSKIATARADHALDVAKKCGKALKKTNEDVGQAESRVTTCLEKRRSENDALRKSLLAEMMEADTTIADAEKLITRLERASSLNPGAKGLADDLQAAQAALAELQASRAKLEDDQRRKTASMKLDESARILVVAKVDARTGEAMRATSAGKTQASAGSAASAAATGLTDVPQA